MILNTNIMKRMNRLKAFCIALAVVAVWSCQTDTIDRCEVEDWIGEYARIDGGGCENWEQATDATLRILQSTFSDQEVVINCLPGKVVNGCTLTHEFAGTTTTWTLKNGRVTRVSDLNGCRAVYEK